MLGYNEDTLGKQIIEEYKEQSGSHTGLTYDRSSINLHWQPSTIEAGQKLGSIAPLFKKLDEKIVEEERMRIAPK
jgi:methionyl-tRNA synthetase